MYGWHDLGKLLFCNGALYFAERAPQMLGLRAVVVQNNHITGAQSKQHRFREHLLWYLDPPAYYANASARYLIYDNVQAAATGVLAQFDATMAYAAAGPGTAGFVEDEAESTMYVLGREGDARVPSVMLAEIYRARRVVRTAPLCPVHVAAMGFLPASEEQRVRTRPLRLPRRGRAAGRNAADGARWTRAGPISTRRLRRLHQEW